MEMPAWLTIELALIPVFLAAMAGLVWMVRLEAQGRNNTKGVKRSDVHIREGQDVKVDIGVLKNDVGHIKEDNREMKVDIREIKQMMSDRWSYGDRK